MKDTSDIIKSYKTDRGKRYGFDFALRGIRIRRQGFFSYQEAFEVMLTIRLDIFKNEYVPDKYFESVNKDITVEDFIRKFHIPKIQAELKNRTVINRVGHFENNIIPFLGNIKLRSLNTQKMEQWVAELTRKGLAKSTQANQYRTFQGVLKDAKSQGFIEEIPKIKITGKLKKTKKVLRKSEAIKLLSKIQDDNKITEDVRNLLVIVFWTGVRLGEGLALHRDDFDLVANKIKISRTVGYNEYETTSTKNNKVATIPLHPQAKQAIINQINHTDNADGWLFKKPGRDRFMDCQVVRRNLKRIAIDCFGAIEGPRVTPHCFRRSLASMLVDANTPVDMVAALLRHNTDTMLKAYNVANMSMLEEKFLSFDLN